jgi:hypothetical protein
VVPTTPILPYSITHCPLSFTNPNEQVLLGGTQPSTGDSIDSLSSQGLSLFHELFHLVLSSGNTVDHVCTSTSIIHAFILFLTIAHLNYDQHLLLDTAVNCLGPLYSLGYKDTWVRRGIGTLIQGWRYLTREHFFYCCGLV